MNVVIQRIIELLEELRNKYGICKEDLEKNGSIIYANGNDGTAFDWKVNDRLCEFGYGVKDGSVWAFKLMADRWGDAEVYCYPHGEMRPVETITRTIATEREAEKLKNIMMEHADNKRLYNCTL